MEDCLLQFPGSTRWVGQRGSLLKLTYKVLSAGRNVTAVKHLVKLSIPDSVLGVMSQLKKIQR